MKAQCIPRFLNTKSPRTLVFHPPHLCKILTPKTTTFILPNTVLRRFKQTFDINTNVKNDVILYKYENEKFYKILNAFSICQFFFWSYLAHFAYTTLRDAPVPTDPNAPWWRRINLGENKYRNTISIFSFCVGESQIQRRAFLSHVM
jgi:hypothetical protein